jgi:hypothetical protein
MFAINGVVWRVVAVSSTNPVLRRPDGSLSVGACDNTTKTIYLSSRIKGAFKRKVLCHEIVHAALFSYGVNLTIDKEELVAELIATFGDEIIKITNAFFTK